MTGYIFKRPMPRPYILFIFTLLAVCTALQAQPDSDYPYDPSLNEYENLAATLLAEDVKHTYGGDSWTDSVAFAFDFVVYNKADKEVARYHNEWNRLTDEALLRSKLPDGRVYEARFSDLSTCKGVMLIDSQEVAKEHMQAALLKSYDRLTNNLRWLLTPLRLLDSGMKLQILPDSLIDGKGMTPMKVYFNDSIASTSDVLLYINASYKSIDRWLIDYDGVYREYFWRLTRRIGPFLFATRLWADDFNTYIQLERIKVKFLTADKVAQNGE